jgi:hypothetical protein
MTFVRIGCVLVALASVARADISVAGSGDGAKFLRALARGSLPAVRALTAQPFATSGRCSDEKSPDVRLACVVEQEHDTARKLLRHDETETFATVAALRDRTRSNGYNYEPLDALAGRHRFVLRSWFDNQEWVIHRLALAIRDDGLVDGLVDLSYSPPDI